MKNKIKNIFIEEELLDEYFPKGDKRRGEVLALIGNLHAKISKLNEQFIKDILGEIDEGIKLTIKLYNHKKGEELGAEIYNYLYKKIKQKAGFEKWIK